MPRPTVDQQGRYQEKRSAKALMSDQCMTMEIRDAMIALRSTALIHNIGDQRAVMPFHHATAAGKEIMDATWNISAKGLVTPVIDTEWVERHPMALGRPIIRQKGDIDGKPIGASPVILGQHTSSGYRRVFRNLRTGIKAKLKGLIPGKKKVASIDITKPNPDELDEYKLSIAARVITSGSESFKGIAEAESEAASKMETLQEESKQRATPTKGRKDVKGP